MAVTKSTALQVWKEFFGGEQGTTTGSTFGTSQRIKAERTSEGFLKVFLVTLPPPKHFWLTTARQETKVPLGTLHFSRKDPLKKWLFHSEETADLEVVEELLANLSQKFAADVEIY